MLNISPTRGYQRLPGVTGGYWKSDAPEIAGSAGRTARGLTEEASAVAVEGGTCGGRTFSSVLEHGGWIP